MGPNDTELAPLRSGARITQNLELLRPLGAGGMGSVWIARHHGLSSNVVVKFMAPELARNAEAVARFRREASAAADVRSAHVVQMLDHGITSAGVPYIAMELLEGESLRQRIDRERRVTPRDVVTIVAHCAKALSRAHERGVVHRDIKPDNIFLTDAGDGEIFAKVLDFGIAKAGGSDMVATTTGAVLGSPYYMSPEQVVGSKGIDARTDLWALGVTAFESLTGHRPFEGETIGALSIAICHGTPPRPSQLNPALPESVDVWFAQACARDPAARFATAKEMIDALARALAGVEASALAATVAAPPRTVSMTTTAGLGVPSVHEPAPSRRSRALLIAVVAIAVGGASGIWLATRDRSGGVTGPATEVPASPEAAPHAHASTAPVATAATSEPAEADLEDVHDAAPATSASPSKPATAPKQPASKPLASTALEPAPVAAAPTPAAPPAAPPPKVTTKVENDPNIF